VKANKVKSFLISSLSSFFHKIIFLPKDEGTHMILVLFGIGFSFSTSATKLIGQTLTSPPLALLSLLSIRTFKAREREIVSMYEIIIKGVIERKLLILLSFLFLFLCVTPKEIQNYLFS